MTGKTKEAFKMFNGKKDLDLEVPDRLYSDKC